MSIHFPSQSAAIWAVADKLGINLPAAIRQGDLTPDELTSMLRACAHCWHGRKCARWQVTSNDSRMPSFCPSSDIVNELSPQDGRALRAVR